MKYKIGGDGWWHTTNNDPVLENDIISITNQDADFYYLSVERCGENFGSIRINKVFLEEDFEEIIE
jgi:hypothetical protein